CGSRTDGGSGGGRSCSRGGRTRTRTRSRGSGPRGPCPRRRGGSGRSRALLRPGGLSPSGMRIVGCHPARSLASRAAWGLLALGLSLGCRRVDDPVAVMRTPPPANLEAPLAEERPPNGGGKTFVVPDFARVAQQLSPSVVTVISTVASRGTPGQRRTVHGVGSGMLVSARGQILTNEHVVAQASRVQVKLSTRARLDARIVYADPLLDLALLE